MKWLLLMAAAFTLTASAADITGTWKGAAETPMGKVERTFVFKQDGAKVTGETTSDIMGKSDIEDGKLDGDNLSFTINVKFQGNEAKINYTGKVKGDEIDMHVEVPGQDYKIDYTVKKVSGG
jgi:hypothetical protein